MTDNSAQRLYDELEHNEAFGTDAPVSMLDRFAGPPHMSLETLNRLLDEMFPLKPTVTP
jgi:hypothetical protein